MLVEDVKRLAIVGLELAMSSYSLGKLYKTVLFCPQHPPHNIVVNFFTLKPILVEDIVEQLASLLWDMRHKIRFERCVKVGVVVAFVALTGFFDDIPLDIILRLVANSFKNMGTSMQLGWV